MGIIKIILEEPEKIQVLIINLIKLVITVLITHSIYPFPELMSLGSIETLKNILPLEQTMIFVLVVVSVWFIIWSMGFFLFIFIISFWRKSNKESKKYSIHRNDINNILKFTKIYTVTEKGFLIPTRHIESIVEIGEVIKSNQSFSLSSTIFVKWLFIATVIWFYFIGIIEFSFAKIIGITFFGFMIFIAIFIWRKVDRILEAFKDYSIEVHDLLQRLLFRKAVIDILENNFSGKLNEEHSGYNIILSNQKFIVEDVTFFNNEMGNILLFEKLNIPHKHFENNLIIVSNIEPDQKLKNLIESLNIKAYILAENREELLVGLCKLGSFLDKQDYKENI